MRTSILTGLCVLTALAAQTLHAASIESLVMPGPVIAGHADLEQECSNCHDLFDRNSQRTLCLDCHEPVAEDLEAMTGFHGRNPQVGTAECKQCHTEHKGRDADVTGLQTDLFDHDLTDFPLTGAHEPQGCSACHEPDRRYAEAPSDCAACHETDDVHAGELGTTCADCHETDVWRNASFDHDTTDFALDGKHTQTQCLGCHMNQLFEAPGGECIDCHSLDDAHRGANGTACADCHDTETWDARFDHEEETGFALEGAHGMLACGNCHVDESSFEGLTTTCIGCHNGDDIHLGGNGTECESCHNQKSWTATFDHEVETDFELLGAHNPLSCNACHSEGLEVPLAVECIGCHEADDPHAATLDDCENCHGQNSWEADQHFHHDLADFALVGLHRVVSCEQCHDSLVFSPLAQDCTDCHEPDDVHEGAMGNACDDCHNPAGWDYWLFDHDTATEFALTGAHENLTCAGCHSANNPAARQSPACVSCHRSDDIHDGGFGQNCGRCHLTSSFEELQRDI